MKHTALIICLLLTTNLFSQVVDDNQRKIKVTGRAQIEIDPTSYAIDIQVKEIPSQSMNYNVPLTVLVSIDSMEVLLKNSVSKAGYDSKKLKQIFMNSSSQGYGSNQSLLLIYNTYEYDLKNLNDVNTFIRKVRFDGMTGMRVRKIFDVNKTEIEAQLLKDALIDARTKAEKLLISTGKSLGEVISIDISSYQPIFNDENYNNWYGNSTQMDALRTKTIATTISVSYEIK